MHRNVRRIFFAVVFIASAIALYISTPPECFEDGPVPRYCVEG